eukprot:918473-Ditylum_brightwellii.AAC.1
MQQGINTWEGGLIVSGGALKPSKCKVQLVGFKFVNDRWTYASPAFPPVLRIKGEDAQGHIIDYVHHTEPLEVVGLLQSPNGCQKAQ